MKAYTQIAMENYTRILPQFAGSSEDVLKSLRTDFAFDKKSLVKFATTLTKYDYEPKNKTLLTGQALAIFNEFINQLGVKSHLFANFLRELNANYPSSNYIRPLSPNTNIIIATLSDSFKIKPSCVVSFLDSIKSY